MYWDAANVKLDELHFYPMPNDQFDDDEPLQGRRDWMRCLNHAVPNPWLDVVANEKGLHGFRRRRRSTI